MSSRKELSILFSLAICTIILLCPHDSHAQQMQRQLSSTLTPGVDEVKRANGWLIPGRNEYLNVSQVIEIVVAGSKVKKKVYDRITETEPLVDLEIFSVGADRKVTVHSTLCTVKNFLSYSTKDHPFAYETALVPVTVDVDGRRHYAGVTFIVRYFDLDGDGRFETRKINAPDLELPKRRMKR